jgi:hypothetical protein
MGSAITVAYIAIITRIDDSSTDDNQEHMFLWLASPSSLQPVKTSKKRINLYSKK